MNTVTVTNHKPPTTAEIMAAVEKLKALAPAAAERCESMQASRSTIRKLKTESAAAERHALLCGLPVRINDALPDGAFCMDMADGSKVVHDGENTYRIAAPSFDWSMPPAAKDSA